MSKFQARHYVATARIIYDNRRKVTERMERTRDTEGHMAAQLDAIDMLADDFQRMFYDDSAGFDSVRFYDACHTGKGL